MSKEYRDKNGELHREDGPALEWADGSKEWIIYGKLHREDGPAIERCDGTKCWYWENKWIMKTKGPVTESQIKEFRLRILK